MTQKPLVFIISAPSGSGKSTLTNELLKLVPNLDFSISYTTRNLRGSEQNGKQYHFVSLEEFEKMIERGDFLEHARVHGNCYGTARQHLREAGGLRLVNLIVWNYANGVSALRGLARAGRQARP